MFLGTSLFSKVSEPATFLPTFSKLHMVSKSLLWILFFFSVFYEPATFLCIYMTGTCTSSLKDVFCVKKVKESAHYYIKHSWGGIQK